MPTVQRPGTIDVSVSNPNDFIYVEGDAETDGSIRYALVEFGGENVAEIQRRELGVWQPTSFKTGANSVIVGTLVTLSAAGQNLITTDGDQDFHFHARSAFTAGLTTGLANIINATAFFERIIFSPDESGEFTGTSISTQTIGNTTHLIVDAFYVKTGATAATSPVRIQAWDGIGNTGTLKFDQTYATELFTANTEVRLTLNGFLEFHVGDDTFTTFSSDETFSLKTNPAVTEWWLAVDFSTIKDDDLLQTTEWVTGDTYTKGDWSTQDKKTYEANVTGTQTGTFLSNPEKWDQLISVQGFDRILNSLTGDSIADNSGNLVIGL